MELHALMECRTLHERDVINPIVRETWMPVSKILDVTVEGVELVRATELNVNDFAFLILGEGMVEHGHKRSQANTTTNQDEGLRGLLELEGTRRREQVDLITFHELVVKVVGYEAAWLSFDAYAIVLIIGSV